MTVYVVVSDDGEVDSVFTDLAKALEVANRLNNDDATPFYVASAELDAPA